MNRLHYSCILGVLSVALGLLAPGAAQAKAPIYEFTQATTSTQAGGHPDLDTVVRMGNRATQEIPAPSCQCQDPKSITIHAPTGVVGVPRALPQCSQADFAETRCPIDTQVGISEVGIGSANGSYLPLEYDSSVRCGQGPGPKQLSCPIAVFNLVPHPGQAGLLGFFAPFINTPVYIVADARTESDYGLEFTAAGILHTLALGATGMTFWGVPADPIHDRLRFGPVGCASQGTTAGVPPCIGGYVSNAPLVPFINNPTTCGNPLTASVEVLAYDREIDTASVAFPATTGCDRLSFNPSLFGQPTTQETDTASGLEVDLKVPQQQSPSTPSPSEIRGTTVTLPEGFSINSSAADGKQVCTDSEAKLGTRLQAECPESSKVGSLEIESDALPGPLPGYIYLRTPAAGDPYRLFLVADGFGLHVKLPGSVKADPTSGRLVTSFQDLPQFPFSRFNMHFFGSERGLLATPEQCGTYSVDSTFTPWNSALPDQSSHQFFELTSGPGGRPCPGHTRPLEPAFEAGVTDKTSAEHTSFVLQMTREDGDQNITGLNVTAPPGFSATLKGVAYCPEASIDQLHSSIYDGVAELAASACPAASQIGTAVAGAGAGSHPVYVGGKVFLAGPYKGAPLSLVVSIPAVSGPYDLGNVAVRAALHVDPVTAQVTAISDPLPQILEGVPLRTRFVRVTLDRPNFALNPTNCDPFSVNATITGDEGASAARSTYFQVTNCASLPFDPSLSIELSGGTKRTSHPRLRAVLKPNAGDANLSSISVALPHSIFLDNSHLRNICTRVAFAADKCTKESVYGNATVYTPILDEPLTGPVYLRSSSHSLPDLVLDLHGQVDVEASARIDSKNLGIRTTFGLIPDIPISEVVLNMQGGSKGLLQIGRDNFCAAPGRATVRVGAQNGMRLAGREKLQTSCGKASKRKRGKHKRSLGRARKAG